MLAKLLFLSLVLKVIDANPTARVVGGINAVEGQFPYQVSIRYLDSHICGGAIISRNFILTAAHCVGETKQGTFYPYQPNELTIRAGSIDRFRGGVLIPVSDIKAHEDYGNYLNDVALIKLKETLIYSKNIQVIPLASHEIPIGSAVVITGWGSTKHGGDMPSKLQWNTLTTITQKECKAQINADSETLLCLAHKPDNGACHGDSGGPAVWNNEIVGIANFIYFQCGTNYPDAYAKVNFYLDWIRKHADLK